MDPVLIQIHRTIILLVVWYGCETLSLTLREERRLTVTGEWIKLNNEDLNNMYCSPNIVRVLKSRRIRWVGHVAGTGERRGGYMVVVGKPEGNRPLG